MAVSLFLEILPGCWPKNFVAEKMLGHKSLLPRTSLATSSKNLVTEKVPRHKILLSRMTSVTSYLPPRKFSITKFNVRVCPR